MTLADAAHIARVPRSTIRRWIHEGKVTRLNGRQRPAMVDYLQVCEQAESESRTNYLLRNVDNPPGERFT